MTASNNAHLTEEKLAEIESRARAAFWGRGDKYGHGGYLNTCIDLTGHAIPALASALRQAWRENARYREQTRVRNVNGEPPAPEDAP